MMHSTRLFTGFPRFLSLALLACATGIGACASKPPPASQDTAPASSGSASASTAIDNTSPTDAGAATATNSMQDASTSNTATTDDSTPAKRGAITVDDGDDACQFAAAAYEKRVRPQIKACYRDGKKKDPNLVGGVRIVVNVKADGKIGNIVTGEKPTLPKPVVKCMVDAVKANDPGDSNKCASKTMLIPVQFPTQ